MEEVESQLILKDDVIYYKSGRGNEWKLSLSEIKVIGELTTNEGPFIDDWFVVFVIDENNWKTSTMYLKDNIAETFFKELSSKLNYNIIPSLFHSTEFKSIVAYPEKIKGKELIELKEVEPQGWWDKLKAKLNLGKAVQLTLTKDVKDFLTSGL